MVSAHGRPRSPGLLPGALGDGRASVDFVRRRKVGERDSSRSVIAPGVMRRGEVEVRGLPRTLA